MILICIDFKVNRWLTTVLLTPGVRQKEPQSSLCRCLSCLPPQGGDRSQHRQHHGHPERVAHQGAEQLPLRGVEAWRRNQVGGARKKEFLSWSTAVHQLVITLFSRSSSDLSQMRRDRSTGTTSATSMSWRSGRQHWTAPGRSGPTTCWYDSSPLPPPHNDWGQMTPSLMCPYPASPLSHHFLF